MAGCRKDLPNFWGRAIIKCPPKQDVLFPDVRPPVRRSFVASFERDTADPPIESLLAWEYGRMWLIERDIYLSKTPVPVYKFIKPDYTSWLKKRVVDKNPRRRKQRNIKATGTTTKVMAKNNNSKETQRNAQPKAKRIGDGYEAQKTSNINANQKSNSSYCAECGKVLTKTTNKKSVGVGTGPRCEKTTKMSTDKNKVKC